MPIQCDLHNPTSAARVIYDGIKNDMPIRIGPKETLRGQLLGEHVVATLKQSAQLYPHQDLEVTELGHVDMPAEPAAAIAAADTAMPAMTLSSMHPLLAQAFAGDRNAIAKINEILSEPEPLDPGRPDPPPEPVLMPTGTAPKPKAAASPRPAPRPRGK